MSVNDHDGLVSLKVLYEQHLKSQYVQHGYVKTFDIHLKLHDDQNDVVLFLIFMRAKAAAIFHKLWNISKQNKTDMKIAERGNSTPWLLEIARSNYSRRATCNKITKR